MLLAVGRHAHQGRGCLIVMGDVTLCLRARGLLVYVDKVLEAPAGIIL
jgi:hypothetical protein